MTHERAHDLLTAALIPVFTWGAVASISSPDMGMMLYCSLFFAALGAACLAASILSALAIVAYEMMNPE